MRHDITGVVGMALFLLASSVSDGAQHPASSANLLSAEVKQAVERVANNLLRLAEKMPADGYALQVVPDIPSFAAVLGETIQFRVRTCAEMTGSSKAMKPLTVRTKEELVAAMRSSMAQCDKAFAGLTDVNVVQMAFGPRGEWRSRLSSLYDMVAHDSEAYGYLVLHLRLKGIEPPTGAGGPVR